MTTGAEAERSRFDRVLAAYPLVVAYVVLLILYGWETSRHSTAWLFLDELQWAGLSRGIAHTGHAELRHHSASFDSLYSYFIAPAWWLGATGRSYAAAKYLNVVAMAASLFPAYGFARLFVTRWAAIGVGCLTASIPALAYTGMLIPEPLAYTWSALTVWLVARALIRRTRRAAIVAVAALVLAPLVRSELAMLILTAVLALIVFGSSSDRARRVTARWSRADWLRAAVLVAGVIIVLGAYGNHHVYEWAVAWGVPGRIFTFGLWAFGAFVIGTGILPAVATIAWAFGARLRERDERALFALFVGAVVSFGLYTAVKAAFLSATFADRVEERNFIYVAPIAFTISARWLLSGRTRVVGTALGGAAVGYLIATTPSHMYEHFYSDAPGLSLLQWLNQKWYFTTTDGNRLLYGVLAGSLVVAVLFELARRRPFRLRRPAGIAAGATLAALALAWNLTGEIAAANGSNASAAAEAGKLTDPPDWIDRDTGRARTIFIGQSLSGTNADSLWLLEFWNQSIQDVWSTDASAPKPGPSITPNFTSPDGEVDPQLPVDWVVAGGSIVMLGKQVDHAGPLRLYRVTHPIRIAEDVGGITPDGWISAGGPGGAGSSWFDKFASRVGGPGTLTVSLTRAAVACGSDVPVSHVNLLVGKIRIDENSQPAIGTRIARRRLVLPQCQNAVVRLHVRPPFRAQVTANGAFQPNAGDQRFLVAQVGFSFVPDSAR